VLVVDDDRAVRESLRRSLEFNGYAVSLAADGAEALAGIGQLVPDVVLLDLILPDGSGLDVTRAIREERKLDVPIIVLSAHGEERTKIEALDLGADDYLTKPFALQELLARLRALLRRVPGRPYDADPDSNRGSAALRFLDLSLHPITREVHRGGRRISLTRTEFTLLELFLRRPRHVLDRSYILEEVWGFDFPTSANSLEVYMGYLRRKTESEGEPRLLHTVRGVGYVLGESAP